MEPQPQRGAHRRTNKDMDDDKFFAGLIASWDADEACDEAGLKKLFGYRAKAPRALFDAYRRELLGVEEKNS